MPEPIVIFASCAADVSTSPPAPANSDASSDRALAEPVDVAFTWSSQLLSAVFTAAAEAPTPAPLIALATAVRLRSPVDTTATVLDPVRRPPSNVSVRSPLPVPTATVAPVPADVTVTAVLVPIWIEPSMPTAADPSTPRPRSARAVPPITCRLAVEPSCVEVSFSRPLESVVAVAPPPAASMPACTAEASPAAV